MPESESDRIERIFRKKFGGRKNCVTVRSPGRVNLIGEHTDYNDGFVLPAAVDKSVVFSVAPRSDGCFHLVSADMGDEIRVTTDGLRRSEKGWPNYLLGVADQLLRAGYKFGGCDAVFGGNVPIGAGLSSSAAVEGGFIFSLNEVFTLGLSRLEMVKMAQQAEHKFAGVNCGIMDQFINIFGEKKKVLKLDCRSLEYEHFPFERDDLGIILCETPARRSLASSEYNTRRSQCESGVAVLKKRNPAVRSLRDATLDELEDIKNEIDPVVYKRCGYVIRENSRVLGACEALKRNDMELFGKRMYESHEGLSRDYEVSSRELDILVELASGIEGVIGSRMMGAGFGGCTINLVEGSKVQAFTGSIKESYLSRTGSDIKVHATKLTCGTERIG